MDNDILIDFNHIYYLISDKLFKEQFPESKDPFSFQNCFDGINFDFLKDDTSFYFLENSTPPLSQQIRHFLKQQGYIEENVHVTLDTKMSDKGIEAVEKKGIENYKSYRERQEQLQFEIQQTTIDTNNSVISTNRLQRISSRISVLVSLLTLVIAFIATYIAYISHLDSQKLLEREKKSFDTHTEISPTESLQLEDSVSIKDKDKLYKK